MINLILSIAAMAMAVASLVLALLTGHWLRKAKRLIQQREELQRDHLIHRHLP